METQDILFLRQTLSLAKKGMSWTFPNPMVGCVIVKNNKIIAEGYHKKVGLPHAEIEAFKNAKEDVRGATLYVNLEPCSHFGKTPPCAPAIIAAGISKVVCCMKDPNPQVAGKGIRQLEEAGIEVLVGTLEQEARQLNEAFITFHEKKRPFVVAKFAASLDGKIATYTGDSKWITNEKARMFARELRSEQQAILVGINTVIHDNPNLGVQIKNKKDPLRIILDTKLRISRESQVLRDKNVLIITTNQADLEKKKLFEKEGFEIIVFNENKIEIDQVLQTIYDHKILSVFVEGGSHVLGSLFDNKVVDKVYAFHAPIIVGGKNAISAVGGNGVSKITEAHHLKQVSFKQFDDNLVTIGYL